MRQTGMEATGSPLPAPAGSIGRERAPRYNHGCTDRPLICPRLSPAPRCGRMGSKEGGRSCSIGSRGCSGQVTTAYGRVVLWPVVPGHLLGRVGTQGGGGAVAGSGGWLPGLRSRCRGADGEDDVTALLADASVIRNRRKISCGGQRSSVYRYRGRARQFPQVPGFHRRC